MTFAFVIPVYNCEKFLAETLLSISSQVEKPDEVIVVDDGSSDRSVEIAKSFGVKVIEQKNAGAAVARNVGVQSSSCDWILFLDGDDIALPERLKKVKEKALDNPSLNLIANDEYEGNDESGWYIKHLYNHYDPSGDLYQQLLRGCFLSTSAVAIKKSLFVKVKGMDSQLRSAQDYDLWLRVAPHAKFEFIKEPLSKYFVHNHSITGNQLKRLECMKVILKKHKESFSKVAFFKRFLIIHLEVLLGSFKSRKISIIPRVFLSLFLGSAQVLITGEYE